MASDDGFSNYLANLVFNHMLRVGSQFQSNKEGQAAVLAGHDSFPPKFAGYNRQVM